MKPSAIRSLFLVSLFLSVSSSAFAAPFNDDMVNIQIVAGQMARPPVEGTVARGSLPARLANKQEASKLENTRKGHPFSVQNGKRLFAVNCYACHGDIAKAEGIPHGPAVNPPGQASNSRFLTPPDITSEFYAKQRSDADIYGVIHFGGMAVMPALGWKLSPEEHWDIVNYVRSIQNSKLAK